MFYFEIDFIDIQCFIYGLYHIYLYTYVVRLRISVKQGGGGGGAVNFGSLFSFPDYFVFSVMTSLSSV